MKIFAIQPNKDLAEIGFPTPLPLTRWVEKKQLRRLSIDDRRDRQRVKRFHDRIPDFEVVLVDAL